MSSLLGLFLKCYSWFQCTHERAGNTRTFPYGCLDAIPRAINRRACWSARFAAERVQFLVES